MPWLTDGVVPIEWHAGDEMSPAVIVLIGIAVVAAVLFIAAIRIVREYERGSRP